MPVNDFERDIQNRLEELKLRPSAEVWQRVAADIRKKKRRRVLAFFLFFFLLLTGGYAGMQFFSGTGDGTGNKSLTQSPSVNQTEKHSNTGISAQKDIVATGQPVAVTPATNNQQQAPAITPVTTPVTKARKNAQPAVAAQQTKTTSTDSKDQPADNNDPVMTQPEPNNSISKLPAIEPAATAETAPGLSATPADTSAASATLAALPETPVDSLATAATPDKKAKAKKKKAWRFGIDGGIGMSGVLAAPLSMKAVEPGQNVLSNGFTQQANVLVPGTVTYLPTAANPYVAWNLGAVVEKQLTRRSTFSAGLRYSYASTIQKAGEYNPTFRANVGEPNNDYVNSFHFVSIPLAYHWQINQARKMPPVTFDIGFTASRLLHTNALLYNVAQGGVYYKDKDLFNKNHFDLTAGFSVRLNAGGRWQWSIGPQAGFDLTNLYLDKAEQDKEFLYYGGLKLRLLLPQR